MTTPTWAPVDDTTADLLSLVSRDEMTPRPDEEWQHFTRSVRAAAEPDGRVDPNCLRELLRGHVAPRRIGSYTHRAKCEGLLVETGDWVTSTDTEGRNAGRPVRVYRLGT